ncbi:hypothetical protein [Urbifossiella limnaea]|uniref:Uncharacterized protein n=1 Tax=Urbifossiella limnaea TaxID=2528023 RepID=A0A517XY57_9BACT|nr:hypothetical protein [Urbifossiella limnaea]QDU22446.1 hypothetical protein ETAA1_44260 [Urbifossiella limnaea]
MRHFSCDLCGKGITAATGPRMVLKLESYPAPDEVDAADDFAETDVVEEVAQLLREAEDAGEDVPTTTRKSAFDLCVPCHRKFLSNPLGRSRVAAPRFSGN